MAISVFLADDHRLLVEGFRVALKDSGIDVVEVAYALDGLVQRYLQVQPDVLVIDLRFEGSHAHLDGLDVCEAILAADRAARIVVFSQFDDQYIVEKTYQLGVLAFVRKDESSEVLLDAIRTANEGKEFFSPVVAQQLAWAAVKAKNPTRLLDAKEFQAFKLVADGANVSDVAAEMALSTKTVGAILKNVKQKLDIESQADFTKLAIKFGVTNLDLKSRS